MKLLTTLLVLLLSTTTNIYSQHKDFLSSQTFSQEYIFTNVYVKFWNDKTEEFEEITKDDKKYGCYSIEFVPSRIDESESSVYKRLNLLLLEKNYGIERDVYGCENEELIKLKIIDYKNTQSSAELIGDDFFFGIGYLETGEKCMIGHNLFKKKKKNSDSYISYSVHIFVNNKQYVYEK